MPRSDEVKRLLLASVLGNAALCALKIVGGALSGSTALLADGSDSLLNVASGALAYKFRREAERPPDYDHMYGHSLLEVYGSLLILILMVATFSFVGFVAADRWLHGAVERIDPVGIPFAAASLALNLAMGLLLRVFGRESTVARTESRHVSLDVVEGLVTLSGVSMGAYISVQYDVMATFALLIIVAFFVAQTLRELRGTITAESPPASVVKEIEDALTSVDGVKGVHSLRVRQAAGKVFADVHLEVDRSLTVEEAHRICDEAESRVKEKVANVDIVIHVEPKGESGARGE